MSPQLKTAILAFLANEFQLEPDTVSPDLNFTSDRNLSPEQVSELLQRLQDALDFVLPEDRVSQIMTVEDLLAASDTDSADSDTTP